MARRAINTIYVIVHHNNFVIMIKQFAIHTIEINFIQISIGFDLFAGFEMQYLQISRFFNYLQLCSKLFMSSVYLFVVCLFLVLNRVNTSDCHVTDVCNYGLLWHICYWRVCRIYSSFTLTPKIMLLHNDLLGKIICGVF